MTRLAAATPWKRRFDAMLTFNTRRARTSRMEPS